MINLLLLTLSLANPQQIQTAQFRPCVWPNTCKTIEAPAVAQFRPCVWPNRCKASPAVPADDSSVISAEVAQFTTCVLPNKCGKKA